MSEVAKFLHSGRKNKEVLTDLVIWEKAGGQGGNRVKDIFYQGKII